MLGCLLCYGTMATIIGHQENMKLLKFYLICLTANFTSLWNCDQNKWACLPLFTVAATWHAIGHSAPDLDRTLTSTEPLKTAYH